MSYFRWGIGSDVTLFLQIAKSDGTGLTGSDPQVMIRRFRTVDGGFLDNYYWNGSTFVVTPTSGAMSELDRTNQPGIYIYTFSQSLIQSGTVYDVFYKHNATPLGFANEYHYFVMTGSDGTIKVYESEAD